VLSPRFLVRRLREAVAARRVRRTLDKAPHFTLATLPEDTLGRVRGIARPLDKRVIEAPLSGRLCVYYAIELDGLRLKQYKPLASFHDAIPFLLDDAGAHAVLDPVAAQVSCGFDHAVRLTSTDQPTRRVVDILDQHLPDRDWRFFSEVRIREAIIEVDEAISVLGSGTREPIQAAGGYRDPAATRLYFAGSPRFPLVISDDP
jgi:hypothetical protein